jgi:SagB-type dehydrogenase family enzyme
LNDLSEKQELEKVVAYHQETKHHPQRGARSLGYMDWATQPDPFRRFEGAELYRLDEIKVTEKPSYDSLYQSKTIEPQPINKQSLAQLFYDSLALSQWKQYLSSRWALRVNPSSGNLHPTEGYLICPAVSGLFKNGGVFHYAPYEHGLERRYPFSASQWPEFTKGLPEDSFLMGLTSIYWRESWKYGERAFRYCQHDIGHAIGAIAMAAAVLGWQVKLLDHLCDQELAILFGTHLQSGIEAEHPECLLVITPTQEPLTYEQSTSYLLPESVLQTLKNTGPSGRANCLSHDHHDWPIIDTVSQATQQKKDSEKNLSLPEDDSMGDSTEWTSNISARQIIRQRRSAVAMDGQTEMSREAFYQLLQRITPTLNLKPFDLLPWTPKVHLGLFVHRVKGLVPGLYFQSRNPTKLAELKSLLKKDFLWNCPDGCPESLGLFLLMEAESKSASKFVSCDQDIAADGAFSLGMIAEFEKPLHDLGPSFYRRLFWETGLIGQILYLEAEALGISATGIGCFYDDVMHEILGMNNLAYQSLYHFTIGARKDDPRIQSEPPYAHRHKNP